MKKIILLIVPIFILYACGHADKKTENLTTQAPTITASEKELNSVFTEFAKMAMEKGFKDALFAYASADVILMREGVAPVIGLDSVIVHFPDGKSALSFDLQTERIKVSSGNDMGYIFGPYKASRAGKGGQEKSKKGSFSSVWKKQTDGKWKFELFVLMTSTPKNKQDIQNNPGQQNNAGQQPFKPY